jgi:hypothetical protein
MRSIVERIRCRYRPVERACTTEKRKPGASVFVCEVPRTSIGIGRVDKVLRCAPTDMNLGIPAACSVTK